MPLFENTIGALKQLAVNPLTKFAIDIRMMASGPRSAW